MKPAKTDNKKPRIFGDTGFLCKVQVGFAPGVRLKRKLPNISRRPMKPAKKARQEALYLRRYGGFVQNLSRVRAQREVEAEIAERKAQIEETRENG